MEEELIEEFKQEASESLEEAELSILAIDRGDEFLSNFNRVFRTFHSIKGGAGMLGLNSLQSTVHHLENLLDQSRTGGHFPKPLVDYLLKGVDATRKLLNGESVDFELINPLFVEKVEPKASAVEVKKASLPVGTVYVVDDDEEVLDTIWDLVTELGYQGKKFLDPKELIKEVRRAPPDVVLSDIKMPGMSGLELLKELHQRLPQVPVILVSGFVSKDAVLEALGYGAFGVVEKPIVDRVLCAQLLNATKQSRLNRLIDRSIKFILYQFSDLDEFLKATGKESVRITLKSELENLLQMRRELRQSESEIIAPIQKSA